MRTNLTSEQHRFEAGRLADESLEWSIVFHKTGSLNAFAWAHAKRVQAVWHKRRQEERLRESAALIETLNAMCAAIKATAGVARKLTNGGKP